MSAQTADPAASAGALRGRVFDAVTDAPLAGAEVTLAPAAAATPPKHTVTGDAGEYEFDGIPPGEYRIVVSRLGYRAWSVDVVMRERSSTRVSLALVVEPIALESLVVARAPRAVFSVLDHSPAESIGRRSRPSSAVYAVGDAHMVGASDPRVELAPLEADLFRALARQPGIDVRDDYSTRLHVRGGAWPDTRVTFDGVPVLDPIHGGGLFAGLAPSGVDDVRLHPGAQPPDLSGGAAGAMRIESRSAHANGVDVGASLAAAHARAEAVHGIWRGSLSARGASLGLLSRIAGWTDREQARDGMPFAFWDVVGRADADPGESLHASVSVLRSRDAVPNAARGGLSGNRASWGTDAVTLTLGHELGTIAFRWRAGRFGHASTVSHAVADTVDPDWEPPTVPAMRSRIEGWRGSVDIAPVGVRTWAAGASWTNTFMSYDGAVPVPLARAPLRGFFAASSREALLAAWAERSIEPFADWTVWGGVRLETGPDGHAWIAPRAAVRYTPSDRVGIELSAGRHVQHEQALAGAGFETGPALTPALAWVGGSSAVPAIRSGIVALHARYQLSDPVRLQASGYARRSHGHLVLEPAAGVIVATAPLEPGGIGAGWASARGEAAGVELSAVWNHGAWSAELSHTMATAVLVVDTTRSPAPESRAHAVEARVAVQLAARTRLAFTFDAGSGLPYRRFRPNGCDPVCLYGPESVLGVADRAGTARSPEYVRLDLSAAWEPELATDAVSLQLGVQLINVLGYQNPGAYLGSEQVPCDGAEAECRLPQWVDRFVPGLPRLPMLSVRVRF